MTQLAELLARIIRERGGYLSTYDKETFFWLEEKAKEVSKMVYRKIRQDIKIDLMILAKECGELSDKEIQSVIESKFLDMESQQ